MTTIAPPSDPRLEDWEELPFSNLLSFYIYRLYDAEDRLLHVGMTSQDPPRRRVQQHVAHQPWGHEIARAECARVKRGDPVQVEIDEIRRSNPLHNKVR